MDEVVGFGVVPRTSSTTTIVGGHSEAIKTQSRIMDSELTNYSDDDLEVVPYKQTQHERSKSTRKYVFACAAFASLNNVLLGYGFCEGLCDVKAVYDEPISTKILYGANPFARVCLVIMGEGYKPQQRIDNLKTRCLCKYHSPFLDETLGTEKLANELCTLTSQKSLFWLQTLTVISLLCRYDCIPHVFSILSIDLAKEFALNGLVCLMSFF
ncbi:hypothetical protein L6452_38605 [Arctium lappa]|uniref:Uncharacterized protein n=1 Tax=Arctium lappa TaxID=4217 RepID=A0ACB8XQ02_ARCLA|nr:hypothetical protein L6452_38605 [Arctium lappa]